MKLRILSLLQICVALLVSGACRNAGTGDAGGMSVVTKAPLPAGVKYEVVKSFIFRVPSAKAFDSRYEALLGDFPKATYVDWSMKAGSRLDTVGMAPPDNEERLAQFFVEFVNNGTTPANLNLSTADGKTLNLGLKLPDGKELTVWEFLGSGMISDYESTKDVLSRHGDEVALHMSFEGQLYCDLAPGERAWLALLFRLPPGIGS